MTTLGTRTLKSVRYLSKNGNIYTNQFTFDDADRLTSVAYPNGGPIITNVYDTGEHLKQARRVDAGGASITYYAAQGFDEFNRLTGITFGNGAATTFSYYSVSKRLTQIATALAGGSTVQSVTSSYDEVGNIVGIQDNVAGHSGAASGTISSAAYDDLNRLTSAAWAGYGSKSYGYDSVGNVVMNGEFGASNYAYSVADIRFLQQGVAAATRMLLWRRGWRHTCLTPAHLWLWSKKLPDGRPILTDLNTALTIESSLAHQPLLPRAAASCPHWDGRRRSDPFPPLPPRPRRIRTDSPSG